MSETVPSPSAPKRRGLFAFFFKSVLGCSVFCVGLLLGTVLALPMLAGDFVKSSAEDYVRNEHKGSLTIGAVALAWFSEQSVEDATLFDPDGKAVAKVSVTLPSLLDLLTSGGARFGTVRLAAEADLVADDAGVTNLERALALRVAKDPAQVAAGEEAGGKDPVEWLAELELDLEIVARRLTWSDAETRALGKPFAIADLKIAAKAEPGAPMTVQAGAQVSGDVPGAFEIDARVNRSSEAGKEWPFGTIEARGNVRGFSSALADGLAGQHGRLAELFGKTFDLTFSARDVTRERGEIALELASKGTQVALSGRVENGVLRAQGERFLDASIALPRAYLDAFVVPHLPPGSTLDFGAAPVPWSVRIDAFEVPIPKGPKLDAAALRPVLEQTTCRLFASLASPIGFENEETQRAFGRACALEGTTLELALEPGQAPRVKLASMLVANERSTIAVDLVAHDAWSALSSGSTPHFDGGAELVDVPVAVLDAVLGTQGRLAEGLGDRLRVDLRLVDAGLDRGTVTARLKTPRCDLDVPLAISGGRIATPEDQSVVARLDAPAGWIEGWLGGRLPDGFELATDDGHVALRIEDLSVPLPPADSAAQPASGAGADKLAFLRGATRANLVLELPSVRVSTRETREAKVPSRVFGGRVEVRLAENGSAHLKVAATLDTGTPGSLALESDVADVWALVPKGGAFAPPPIDATFELTGVAPALLDAFAGTGQRLRGALGGPLALHVETHKLEPKNGILFLKALAPRLDVVVGLHLEQGVLRCSGEEGLALLVKVEDAWLQEELAPFLPPDMRVSLGAGEHPVTFEVRDIEWPMPDWSQSPGLATMLAPLSARAELHVTAIHYEDARTRAAGKPIAFAPEALTLSVRPAEPRRTNPDGLVSLRNSHVGIGGMLSAGDEGGRCSFAVNVEDWLSALRDPSSGFPIQLALFRCRDMSTSVLDTFAGEVGLFSSLLGPSIQGVEIGLSEVDTHGAEISISFESTTTDIEAQAALRDSELTSNGIQLTLRPTQAWLDQQLTPKLPTGAKLSLPTDAEPLRLHVKNLRASLPKPAAESTAGEPSPTPDALASTLDLVAGLALDAELVVPELVYSDAKTDAAGRPIAIRALKAEAKLVPDALPFVRVTGIIADEPPGEIVADVRALDPLKLLAEEGGADRFRVACDVEARGVPTALVDVLAGQDGLLVEALGNRVQATVKSAGLSMDAGTITADLTSDLHSVHCEGAMQDGTFRITKQDGLAARVGLGPIVNERVVGRLVPMLVNLKKPDGSTPALLAVDQMSFPFDGNLRALDASVRIDLGEVTYALLPGLDQMLGNLVELKPTKIPAFTVPIKQGVASYERFQVNLGGHACSFSGSFDLVDLTLKLDTEIPLKVLGKKASKELEKVREYLNPDLAVPIEIRGSWKKPKVSIGDAFVKKVVADAAGKGLGDLLEGLLDKKKKKD